MSATNEDDELEGFFATNSSNAAPSAAAGNAVTAPANTTAKTEPSADNAEDSDEDEGGVELLLNTNDLSSLAAARPYNTIAIRPIEKPTSSAQQTKDATAASAASGAASHPQSSAPSTGPIHPFRLAFPNESLYERDLDSLSDKPWRRPGADITDWFNYGFDEETWRVYCAKQIQQRQQNRAIKAANGTAMSNNAMSLPPQQPMQQQQPPSVPSRWGAGPAPSGLAPAGPANHPQRGPSQPHFPPAQGGFGPSPPQGYPPNVLPQQPPPGTPMVHPARAQYHQDTNKRNRDDRDYRDDRPVKRERT